MYIVRNANLNEFGQLRIILIIRKYDNCRLIYSNWTVSNTFETLSKDYCSLRNFNSTPHTYQYSIYNNFQPPNIRSINEKKRALHCKPHQPPISSRSSSSSAAACAGIKHAHPARRRSNSTPPHHHRADPPAIGLSLLRVAGRSAALSFAALIAANCSDSVRAGALLWRPKSRDAIGPRFLPFLLCDSITSTVHDFSSCFVLFLIFFGLHACRPHLIRMIVARRAVVYWERFCARLALMPHGSRLPGAFVLDRAGIL